MALLGALRELLGRRHAPEPAPELPPDAHHIREEVDRRRRQVNEVMPELRRGSEKNDIATRLRRALNPQGDT